MPNSGALTSFTATYSNDSYIRLEVNANTGNPNNMPERLYFSRWNQADNSWGGEYYVGGSGTIYSYDGNDPGSIAPVANRKYRWRVRGWRSDGNSGFGPWLYSDYVQTTPAAPSGAAVSLVGPTALNASWANNATNPFYDYRTSVFLSLNGGAWESYADLDPGVTSIHIPGLTPGGTYKVGIQAYDTYGAPMLYSPIVSTASIQAIGTPAAPTGVIATRTNDTSAVVTWANNSTAGAPYSSVSVQRWDSGSGAWATIADVAPGSTSLTDNGIIGGRKYQWRVTATNGVGTSGAGTSDYVYTTPLRPSGPRASYTGGQTITLRWTNASLYSEYQTRVQAYKDGVADGAVVVLTGGADTFQYTFAPQSTYDFDVWTVSNVGALESTKVRSNAVLPSAPPAAPVGLNMGASVIDVSRTHSVSWQHNPSDGSDQFQYQIRHRLQGNATWTEAPAVASGVESATNPFSTYANGTVIEWQVRTYGIDPSPSPYSASALQTTSTTPTVTVTSPAATITTSQVSVGWNYFDAESTAQSAWKVDLYESATGTLLASQAGDGAASSAAFSTPLKDGSAYRADVRVRDGSGLWSDKASRSFTAAFIPPAEVKLGAEVDPLSGASVLSLTPTAHDNGVTTLPASTVTIERRFYDPETEAYGTWETLIAGASPTAILLDPTGPAHDDGEYRVTTHSTAPSTYRSGTTVKPPAKDQRWLYVSGGPQFDVVCKMWANIEISQKASRAKELHYFAGRRNPVIYTGTAAERVFSVAGILEDEATDPNQWIRLARSGGPVLLRAPGRRMYGSLADLEITRIQHQMHSISFTIQEVSI